MTTLTIVWLCTAQNLLASDPADLCRYAAATASQETGVPAEVLTAITLTETGRNSGEQLQPWPWTINSDGEGHWFANRSEAQTYAEDLLRAGRTRFDVGCFQINMHWHGDAFASLEAMFDPVTNARYAAQFLAGLAQETGGWSAAAGAYHSRTEALAERYRARFDAIIAGMAVSSPGVPAADPLPSPQGYSHPLLQAREGPRTPGSLVPLASVPST
jgi:soluble lytic murein transglycosylase-like protein